MALSDDPAFVARKQAARARCTRDLVLHPTLPPAEWLRALADSPYAALASDTYGAGGAVATLEARVATLLDLPAGLFFAKGVAAQQVALRLWAGRIGRRGVVVHALSHLVLDEADALAVLNPVDLMVIEGDRPITVADLDALDTLPAVVAYELPLRRGGFLAPAWDDLVAVSRWCRDRGVAFHLDGARIWETAPGLGRSLGEIAALADSIYVSFYKGLGAVSGAMLLGPADFVAEAHPWRTRFGSAPYRNFPAAIGALDGLDRHLPRMGDYHDRARRLWSTIAAAGFGAPAAPPVANAFRVTFASQADALEQAHLALVEAGRTWWFNVFRPIGDGAMAEVMIGSGAHAIGDDEVVAAIAELTRRATQ